MGKATRKYEVVIADDHKLMRTALAKLINSFDEYSVLFEADNGKDLRVRMKELGIPDIVLLDVNMPEMNGFETTEWLFRNYPQVKVMALSMLSDEKSIIRMFRLGAKGYLLKNTEPEEFKKALDSIVNKNVYLSDYISSKLVSGLHNDSDREPDEVQLNEKEKEFLRWTCSELSYKEIAEKMYLSPRTIDDYRQSLFNKLNVHSRVGLVMYAVRQGIVDLDNP